jgi:predicted nucleotidyltransferase
MTPGRIRIEVPREQVAEFCRLHHIRWLALFGSVLRDDFRSDSDVDVLIEFEQDQPYTYFTLFDLERDLSALLGRTVDLHVRKSLHPFLREKVLGQAEALYVGS